MCLYRYTLQTLIPFEFWLNFLKQECDSVLIFSYLEMINETCYHVLFLEENLAFGNKFCTELCIVGGNALYFFFFEGNALYF
jgi:hypothetical protein